MALDNELVAECANEYHKSVDRLAKLVRVIVERLESELRRHQILARVSGRVKTRDSVSMKLDKWSRNVTKSSLFGSKHDVFSLVGDLAAVRVMTYVEQDRERVSGIAKEIFAHRLSHTDFEYEVKEQSPRIKEDSSNYYRATHMQICLRQDDLGGDNSNLKDDHCELQITSMLSHVWNEIEHDIGYKGDKSALSDEEISSLDSLGLLTKSGDNIIVSLINASVRREKDALTKKTFASKILVDENALSECLLEFYGNPVAGKIINYSQNNEALFRALFHLNLLLPQDIFQIITPKLLLKTSGETIPAFKKFLAKKQLSRPRIAPQSCDLFLLALISAYWTELTKQVHVGHGPKPRQLAFALRYERFISATQN
ncbi:RelA/SpoT domain-containing protein [Mesorhizobium sp.]|uniref:RelA/SpoT domain-containing protein n=1 Tax=Mesorhizobium sp. TaxID=1871066 RepID=UPI0025F7E80C|nr:RelA/SpoT domain-containing protein [Mesorhizobium sp.]